jgi:uncharacterized protein YbjQ (UPF0145 family)
MKMNEFIVNCPGCGFSFSADESHAGLGTTCANCSREFVIQEPTNSRKAQTFSGQQRPDQVVVTSSNIDAPYEPLGMVCVTLGTRGEMKSTFESLKTITAHKMAAAKSKGQVSESRSLGQLISGVGVDSDGDLAFSGQYSGASFQSSDMEIAFHIAIHQLQLRARYMGANAIIGFRYDIDFDSNANVLNFIATAYGTAVRITLAP